MLIRKGDMVEVIAGDDAGTATNRRVARVLRIVLKDDKVVVEGVNRVYRHMKPSKNNAQGGRLSKEMPISVSNVQLFCPTCARGRRFGKQVNGLIKQRVCKKCGTAQGQIGGKKERVTATKA